MCYWAGVGKNGENMYREPPFDDCITDITNTWTEMKWMLRRAFALILETCYI